ncbi:uncharacterized protein ACB057_006716 [Neosynchiropus ocellatus]
MYASWMCVTLLGLSDCLMMTAATISYPKTLPCNVSEASNSSAVMVDCTERGLVRVPPDIPRETTNLTLTINHIHEFNSSSFSHLDNLTEIDMRCNCVPIKIGPKDHMCTSSVAIQPGTFTSLRSLRALYLDGNQLSEIPRGLPPDLVLLSLEVNHIYDISRKNLSDVTNVQILYLGQNCYYRNPCNVSYSIEEGAFAHLNNLTLLSLKSNNLSFIPHQLPATLKELYLYNNNIESVTAEDFRNLTNLEILDISGNCPRCYNAPFPCTPCPNNSPLRINCSAFEMLTKLKTLRLRSNSLRSVPPKWFHSTKDLKVLDLSSNFLSSEIASTHFPHYLGKLEEIDLSFNYELQRYPRTLLLNKSFSSLTSLKIFRLKGYVFQQLRPESIHPLKALKNLEIVDLGTNFIKMVNLSILMELKSFKIISLSDNKISLPSDDHETSPKVNELGSPMPDDVREIHYFRYDEYARSCKHKDKELGVLMSFVKKECSDFGKTLDVSRNNLFFLHSRFLNLGELRCLNLSGNLMSQSLNGTEFTYLRNLRYLDFSSNRLDLLYSTAFQELKKLAVLDISHNDHYFESEGVTHMLNFTKHLKNLKKLMMNHNKISTSTNEELESESLEHLEFRDNRLDVLWRDGYSRYLNYFKKLVNLAVLDISHNNLNYIPPKVFSGLPAKLSELYLRNNHLKTFDWENLGLLTSLQVLDLSRNSLTQVPPVLSASAKALKKLILRDNYLIKLTPDFLKDAFNLTHLDLSFNHIKYIEQSSFPDDVVKQMHTLLLNNNRFLCTCKAASFVTWLNNTTVNIPRLGCDVACDAPGTLRGSPVISVDLQACQHSSLSIFLYTLTTCSVLSLLVLSISSHLFLWDVWYIYHFCWAKLQGYKRLHSQSNVYDAFVLYDKDDPAVSEWVWREMSTNLEERGDRRLTLCLEERDWIPGCPTVDSLSQSIHASKRTVFILTNRYIKSGSFKTAFYMAHQRLMDEKKDVIVLILLEKVSCNSKYLRLRRRLCKRSVLEWPTNPQAEPYFWFSLRSVLLTEGQTQYNSLFKETLRTLGTSNMLLFFLCFSGWPATANWTSPTFPCDVRLRNNSAIIFLCNERSLEEVPFGITGNATELDLSDNFIKKISAKDLSHLHHLTSLKLNWANKEGRLVISKDAFKNLTQLRNLSLVGNHLQGIPTNLPAGLRKLDLFSNKIRYLNKRMLAGLANITTLYVNKNCYSTVTCGKRVIIEDDSLLVMTQLNTLDISLNNLTKVPKGLPKTLVDVKVGHNSIQAINENDFLGLSELSVLFLQGNCPRCSTASFPCVPCQNQSLYIHPNAFQNLTKLKTLHLGGNSLTFVNPSWFENLHDLKVLVLSFNLLLPVISSEAKFLTHLHRLEILDLSFNYQPGAFPQNMKLSANFSLLKSLQVLHLPGLVFQQIKPGTLKPLYHLKNLTILDLGTNFLIRYEPMVLKHFSHVKVIYLAENRLSPLSEQTQLHSGNGHSLSLTSRYPPHSRAFSFIESHHFIKQECLDAGRVLSLSYNNLFFITPQQFEGYDDVACLNLSGNGFSMAPNGTEFSSVPNLTYLDLSYNKVDLAYNSSFRELQKLEVLDLSYNPHYFEAYGVTHNLNFLKYLPVLRVLNMSHNSIATLTTKQMSSRSLAELQFGNNGLGQKWQNSIQSYNMLFTNLTNLTILDISFNGIKNIPDEVLQHFPRTLTKLSLSNNLLTKFHWEKLKQFEQLQVLNLSYNSLTHVVGIQSHSLTFLDLAHNKIFRLDDGFLSGAPSLKTLSLIKNCLTTINQSSFETKPKIETLMIHQNPLQCTCDSLDFILWIESGDIKIPKLAWDVKCDLPPNQKGKLLTHFETNKCVNDSLAFLMYIWSTSFTLLFMLVATVSHLFYWDAFYALHYVRAKLKGYRKLNSKHNVYDVFVTYDTTDADVSEWVMTNLRPQLEDDGDYLPLCLEERDWPAGVPLVDNLVQSIRYSRKTLFVLTQGYVKTGVFRLAMYLAHQRLLEENEDVIVLLMLEPVLQYSHLLRLRERLCGKSVVRWPKTPAAEPWFWQNLRSVVRVDNEVMYNKTYSKYFNSR